MITFRLNAAAIPPTAALKDSMSNLGDIGVEQASNGLADASDEAKGSRARKLPTSNQIQR
jgi:hypothetical protein